MPPPLMMARRFAPLFWTQFFSALNDNVLKNALVFLILVDRAGAGAEALVTIAGAVFIAPFFVLSGLGGQLADRFDKARVAQTVRLAEIAVAVLAAIGLVWSSIPILFMTLLGFGIVAALFGPVKYGILPDHLRTAELPAGNALIEGATFVAILLGTVIGGIAIAYRSQAPAFGLMMVAVAALAWATSRLIPATTPADPSLRIDINILRSTGALIADLWSNTRLWRAATMTSLFWMIGAIALSLLPPLVRVTMGGTEAVVSVYLGAFAIGIAAGSGLASWWSAGRINVSPVPYAALAMGLVAIDLGIAVRSLPVLGVDRDIQAFFANASAWHVGLDLVLMAVAGGLFVVPAFAAVQAWAPVARRARVVGATNALNAAYIVAGALAIGALQSAGLSVGSGFFVLAGICVASAAWMAFTLPAAEPRRVEPSQDG